MLNPVHPWPAVPCRQPAYWMHGRQVACGRLGGTLLLNELLDSGSKIWYKSAYWFWFCAHCSKQGSSGIVLRPASMIWSSSGYLNIWISINISQPYMLFTFIVNIKTTEDELHTLQCLTQRLMVVADVLLRSFTEWQRKVWVGLLSVVIRADCVHP